MFPSHEEGIHYLETKYGRAKAESWVVFFKANQDPYNLGFDPNNTTFWSVVHLFLFDENPEWKGFLPYVVPLPLVTMKGETGLVFEEKLTRSSSSPIVDEYPSFEGYIYMVSIAAAVNVITLYGGARGLEGQQPTSLYAPAWDEPLEDVYPVSTVNGEPTYRVPREVEVRGRRYRVVPLDLEVAETLLRHYLPSGMF